MWWKTKYWKTPEGKGLYTLFDDMARQPHLLVAGATGSGKSVVLNGIIFNLLHGSPEKARFIFLDPKRVELIRYKNLPHCDRYATEPDDMVLALQAAIAITDERYKEMAKRRLKQYEGGDIFVIIDELADLMTTDKRRVQPLLQRLCQIGRAAKVHVIAATQCPLAAVIPTPIKVNFDARVALRTRSAQDSRNILGLTGCELLPRYGQGYFMKPEGTKLWKIPLISESDLDQVCAWWNSKKCLV